MHLQNLKTVIFGLFCKDNISNSFKVSQSDKIIKIIWENIYPINQYKEKVQAGKSARIKKRQTPLLLNLSIHL